MSREVISDDMNLPSSGLTGHDVGKKRHELLACVSRGGFTNDLSCLCIQRCVQRERSVSVIFKPMSLCSSRRHRQHRIQSVQSLDAALFIHTENCSMLRRIHIKPNDFGCLLLKLWVLRHQVALDPMWLKTRSLPDPSHHHVMNPKMFGQLARTPVRRAIRWRPARPFQNLSFQTRRPFLHRAARMARVQTGDAVFQKALLPTHYESRVAGQLFLDRLIGFSFSQHEYQPRATNVAGRHRPRPGAEKKLFLFGGSQLN
jgi:hypothetical protein